jgi:hypothetical protein
MTDTARKLKITTKKLDDLWSQIVKSDGKCEVCGRKDTLNSHHIFSRSNMSVRWDLDNGICLCVAHHVFANFSAHKAPMEFTQWILAERGEKWFVALRTKARTVVRKIDKTAVYVELKTKLDELNL